MERNTSREAYEDQVIAVADKIKADIFKEAEKTWYATPEHDRNRPWPRCHNIECNRSLTCLDKTGGKCEGFDF